MEALGVLVSVMLDTEAPHNARVSAANSVLDRGFGRAPSTISITDADKDEAEDAERRAFAAILVEATRSAAVGLSQVEIL